MVRLQAPVGQWVDEQERAVAAKLVKSRVINGVQRHELAEALGIEEEELIKYEEAREPTPASILYIAGVLLEDDAMMLFSDDNATEHQASTKLSAIS